MKRSCLKIKKSFKNITCLFLIGMAIQAFTFKTPYTFSIGIMFLIMSFIIFPFEDKLKKYIKIKFTRKQKVFLLICTFLLTAYLIAENETCYVRSLCLLIINLLLIFIMNVRQKKLNNLK